MMTCGCRSRKATATHTAELAAATAVNAASADTLRTHSGSSASATATTAYGAAEQTHIHLDRDSAGRLTDIKVDRRAAGGKRTDSKETESKVAEAAGTHNTKAVAATEGNSREVKPVTKEGRSGSPMALAACILFVVLGIYNLIRRRK